MTCNAAGNDEEEKEEISVMECSQQARNMVDQATREINAMFGGGNSWGNDSALPSSPPTLGIYGGAALSTMQHAKEFAVGGNEPNARTTAASLHWTLMGGTLMQHNVGVGGNGVGGEAAAAETPTAATDTGQQQFLGRGSTVWSALTASIKMFGLATTTQEFSIIF